MLVCKWRSNTIDLEMFYISLKIVLNSSFAVSFLLFYWLHFCHGALLFCRYFVQKWSENVSGVQFHLCFAPNIFIREGNHTNLTNMIISIAREYSVVTN